MKLSAKILNATINVTAVVALALGILFVLGVISEETMYLIGGLFGLSGIAAFRELFASEALKSRLVLIGGALAIAVFGYGYLTHAEWADLEKFKIFLYVIFGLQIGSLAHGAVKANFQKVIE